MIDKASVPFIGKYSLIMISLCFYAEAASGETKTVERWGVYDITYQGPTAGNPYLHVSLKAEFIQGSFRAIVPGFYDGNGVYRIRFSPDRLGKWSYVTQSNSAELSGHQGSFNCIPPTGDNHGPLRIVNTYYLEYADGTPFYPVGTTAYQWTSVKQSIQDQTLKTLAESPFNKIRMCVFPIAYQYGNETEPWQYPFVSQNTFTQPNYAFFQNLDKRIRQLLDHGIQADLILFHPYDKWGYAAMGKKNNRRYVRYMIARLSAYRNIWWSLANEWDIPSIKDTIDWEGIGTLLQNEDPHQRFRSIHNWHATEDHFYDHTRPWITHTSTQTAQFYHAIKWRKQYRQPLLFDEMRYEGDVKSNWGNMSSEEMASYFWMAGFSGGYGTHGDTFRNKSDTETEVRWWAKGGLLVGSSPQRIAFFRSFMETLPVKEMIPSINDDGNPKNLNNNVYTLAKEGEVYLAYAADADIHINLSLAGQQAYRFEVLDTWNMETVSKGEVQPGEFHYITQKKYEAIYLSAKKGVVLPTEDPPVKSLHPLLAEVIQKGPYQPQWESLVTHPMPDWFGEAKIGLSAHWGPYAVPGWTPRKDSPYGVAYAEWYCEWLKQNAAVKEYHKKHYGNAHGTRKSPVGVLPQGRLTHKSESNTLYYHVYDWPDHGNVELPGVYNEVTGVSLLANGETLEFNRLAEDLLLIKVPQTRPDPYVTVIEVKYKGVLRAEKYVPKVKVD